MDRAHAINAADPGSILAGGPLLHVTSHRVKLLRLIFLGEPCFRCLKFALHLDGGGELPPHPNGSVNGASQLLLGQTSLKHSNPNPVQSGAGVFMREILGIRQFSFKNLTARNTVCDKRMFSRCWLL